MHQIIWKWVGVCSVDKNTIKSFTITGLVAHLTLIIASVTFFMQADYIDALHAISLISMIVSTAHVHLIGLIKQYRVVAIFEELSKIHIKCSDQ